MGIDGELIHMYNGPMYKSVALTHSNAVRSQQQQPTALSSCSSLPLRSVCSVAYVHTMAGHKICAFLIRSIYVFMYLLMCACMYVCMYVYLFIYLFIYLSVCVRSCDLF